MFTKNFKKMFIARRKKGSDFLAFPFRLVIRPDYNASGPKFRFSTLRVSFLIDACDLPQSLKVNAGIAS
jgi:hypothetical protein